MAANPIKQKLLGDIEQAGGWENLFERVASSPRYRETAPRPNC